MFPNPTMPAETARPAPRGSASIGDPSGEDPGAGANDDEVEAERPE